MMNGATSERGEPVKIQVRVGPSRIAGQGLFAAQDMKHSKTTLQRPKASHEVTLWAFVGRVFP